MAKRDPVKTARNRKANEIKEQLRALLPSVLAETGIKSESSINALIGGKAAEYIDLHHEVILSAEAYVDQYLRGFKAALSPKGTFENSHRKTMRRSKPHRRRENISCCFFAGRSSSTMTSLHVSGRTSTNPKSGSGRTTHTTACS